MKKIITMLFLGLLVSSVFAVDLVKYGTYEGEKMETIDVYFDFGAAEPFDIKNQSIKHFLFLQEFYEEVEVCLENIEDWWLYSEAIKHNCYNIFIESEDICGDIYINNDDTVTVYTYHIITNQENEE